MLTIPNGLTFIRFLGIPLFIYLALVEHSDALAIATLVIGGATDYFDGKVARALHQESKFGEIADPTIDRLYIAATLIVLYLREAIPLWLILILVLRDLFMAIVAAIVQIKGFSPLKVTYLGKAATFNLLYAFPFLLLALSDRWYGAIAYIFGWAFALWGVALYIGTAVGYFRTAVKAITVRPDIIEGNKERAMSHIPADLYYTKEHEWVAPTSTSLRVRMGITDYAQGALGDIVYVQLPKVGESLVADKVCGEVESTKSVSEIFAPVTGVVTAINGELSKSPELINSDPYGQGWLVEIDLPSEVTGLLSAGEYREITA